MRTFRKIARALCLCLAVGLASLPWNGPTAAQTVDYDQAAAREALRRGEILPLARILSIANTAVPGDVVLVRLVRQNYGWRYRVRILTETGRLRLVRLDAGTGRIIEIVDE